MTPKDKLMRDRVMQSITPRDPKQIVATSITDAMEQVKQLDQAHARDALSYGVAAPGVRRPIFDEFRDIDPEWMERIRTFMQHPRPMRPREKTVGDFTNAELVMELLTRGFAVIKMPEAGGLPDVLQQDPK